MASVPKLLVAAEGYLGQTPKSFGPIHNWMSRSDDAECPSKAPGGRSTCGVSPPHERHGKVFEHFDALKPGETLLVVNDHEPVHLVAFMTHERRDFDAAAYSAREKKPGEWVGAFKAREPWSTTGVRP